MFKHFDIDPEAPVSQDFVRDRLGMLAIDVETSMLSPTQARQRLEYAQLLRDALHNPPKYKALNFHEKVLKDYDNMRKHRDDAFIELETQLRKAVTLEILARYGDYMVFEFKKCKHQIMQTFNKDTADDKKTREDFSVQCSKLQVLLQREALLPDGVDRTLTGKVALAEADLNWPPGTALFIIRQYAERNESVHKNLKELICGFKWSKLGKQCDKDIAILDSLIGPDKNGIRADLEDMITRFRDTWVESHGLDETRRWYEVRRPIKECIETHKLEHLDDLQEAARFGDDFDTSKKEQWDATMEKLKADRAKVVKGPGHQPPAIIVANQKIRSHQETIGRLQDKDQGA